MREKISRRGVLLKMKAMGKRKLIWSQSALNDMTEIFDYYNKRNKSKTYSTKLLGEFRAIMRLILVFSSYGDQDRG